MTPKQKFGKLWHWKLDYSDLPNEWEVSPASEDEALDLEDDPENTGLVMLRVKLGSDELILQAGGSFSNRKEWKGRWTACTEGAFIVWDDSEMLTTIQFSASAACRWALTVYLKKADDAITASKAFLVAQMHGATVETCTEVMKSLHDAMDRLEALSDCREAAVATLARLSGAAFVY